MMNLFMLHRSLNLLHLPGAKHLHRATRHTQSPVLPAFAISNHPVHLSDRPKDKADFPRIL